MKRERLFHLMPVEQADAFLAGHADWTPPSLASEGFVHLSFASQLADTLDAHYAGADAMMLLEVSAERAAPDLRLEASRGGAEFPHLYRALTRADVVQSWRVERDGSGWSLPYVTSGHS